MSAIVLDGQLKSALACVRSLGRKDIPVIAGADRPSAMALHSRSASGSFVYPSPYKDARGFIEAVKKEAIRVGDSPLIYALSDATYCALHTHREELAPYAELVFPEEKAIELAFNKAATYSLARVSGVPVIPTYAPDRDEELELLGPTLSYPAVVKPRRSMKWGVEGGVSGTAVFVRNIDELRSEFRRQKERFGETPLVQEMVKGKEYGVEALVHKGEPYALFSHRRVRSLSPRGGASVVKETLEKGALRNTLLEYAKVLMAKLEWEGPIMVEFKIDDVSGEAYLMEVNGRFWGSLPLSVAAGVDMPYLFYQMVKHGEVGAQVEGREVVRTVHTLGDLMHLLRVLGSFDPMRSTLYPHRGEAIVEFFFDLFEKNDVWSLKDPKPAMMEVIDVIERFLWK